MTVFKVLNQVLTSPVVELVNMSYNTVNRVSLVTCKQSLHFSFWCDGYKAVDSRFEPQNILDVMHELHA